MTTGDVVERLAGRVRPGARRGPGHEQALTAHGWSGQHDSPSDEGTRPSEGEGALSRRQGAPRRDQYESFTVRAATRAVAPWKPSGGQRKMTWMLTAPIMAPTRQGGTTVPGRRRRLRIAPSPRGHCQPPSTHHDGHRGKQQQAGPAGHGRRKCHHCR